MNGKREDTELKAKELLSMTTLMAMQNSQSAAGYDMAIEVLRATKNLGGTSFGVISYPDSIQEIQHDARVLPVHLQRIMERVNLWATEESVKEQAVFVLDTLNSRTNPILSKHFTEFLLKSSAGKKMRRIVPNPFWVDSKTTVGSQVADIIAHVLMNSAREVPNRKEGLYPIWKEVMAMEFNSYDGPTHGIIKMRRQA